MRLSVVTPSFRNSKWLKLCIASVADQQADVEHIVQDGGSDDGTLDWLLQDERVQTFVEKDAGMYDAVNRGLRRARGDVLAYLNCDEQYLPDTAASVLKFLQLNPGVDVVFCHFVVVNGRGEYLFHRKVQTPLKHHTWVAHLPTFTCATFFRRRVIDELGMFFDPRWRNAGDGEWMLRLLKEKVGMAVLPRFSAVFTLTGGNLSLNSDAREEARALRRSAPPWVRAAKPLFVLHHRCSPTPPAG